MKYNDNFAQKFMNSFMGKKEEEKCEVKIPHIREMLKDLVNIKDEEWGIYAFVNPNKVTIFKDSVDKAIDLIDKENLQELFNNVNIEEILLAHEIFHYIEEHNRDDMFTQTEKIRLWKLGPFKNDSNIVCLGEIAGMAFAKELLQLSYSPYILDSFLVYLYYPKVAYELYKEIMNINR